MSDENNNLQETPQTPQPQPPREPETPQFPIDRIEINNIPIFPSDRIEKGDINGILNKIRQDLGS